MDVLIYNKQAIPYEKKDGNYAPSEYEEFLQDIVSSHSLDEKLHGIAAFALHNGTDKLSPKQLYVLHNKVNYKLEHCSKCHAVLAVSQDAEWPFFCDMHDWND